MKIIAIGYYDDYARFFASIKKELKSQNNSVQFKYLTINLSGFLYWLFKEFELSTLLPYKAWFKVLKNRREYEKKILTEYYKNINLNKIINFDKKLNKLKVEDIKLLKLQACAYIDIVNDLFLKYKPDRLILSDDSRLVIEVIDIIAKQNNIKTYYFEQGPFGTTIFDEKGVNANASIRDVNLSNDYEGYNCKLEKVCKFFIRTKSKKSKRNPLYRSIDYVFNFLFNKTPLNPIDLKKRTNKKSTYIIYKKLKTTSKFNNRLFQKDNNILLILQVPNDVNLVNHSPLFNNHFDIVDTVYKSLPKNYNLIVREHPLYKSKYEKKLYEIILNNKNIYLDIDSNLSDTIKRSSLVVVNNSTVGVESIARFKSTIVLGDSYYDIDKICFKLKHKMELRGLIKIALNKKKDNKLIVDYLYKMCFHYLIDGHFRDDKLKSPRFIARKILKKT